jgi:SAM-dependent methyltransferase
VVDATEITSKAHLQDGHFTKIFSNAAMHWILRPAEKRAAVFQSVRDALSPNGVFVFELGGLGNVPEMQAAIMMAVARRVGLEKTAEVNPWFFPDEVWLKQVMEDEVGGWRIEKMEREWRPTPADKGGVDGWVRLMGQKFFDIVPESERESCIVEAVDVLRIVCANPRGGEMISYVRLRCVARRIGI